MECPESAEVDLNLKVEEHQAIHSNFSSEYFKKSRFREHRQLNSEEFYQNPYFLILDIFV